MYSRPGLAPGLFFLRIRRTQNLFRRLVNVRPPQLATRRFDGSRAARSNPCRIQPSPASFDVGGEAASQEAQSHAREMQAQRGARSHKGAADWTLQLPQRHSLRKLPPPSTKRLIPVMKFASSEARKSAA
jgi:hypothetical protein